jgi:sigma-B regulation protein RsbU (phosphoserine phosphatase)
MSPLELARLPIEIEAEAVAGAEAVRAPREATFRGMRCVDISGNPRIPIFMEMVGELSRAAEPKQVLKAFSDGLRRMNGPRGYVSISTRGLRPGKYKITRLLTDPNQHIEDADPWRTWNAIPVQRGGFFGEIIRNAYPELIHHLYLRDDPVVGDALAKYGSMMAIPLFENGEPLNWSIQLREEAEGFTEAELEESILRANLGGATVRNVMITQQLRQANERIRNEIEQIAKIQRALLPQTLPSMPGLSIAASYETFDTAGGDMYDLQVLRRPVSVGGAPTQEVLAMLIADAAGHGPAAAVVSAMLNAILHAYPASNDGPAAILRHANRHLHAKQIDGMFVTAFMAMFDPSARTLVYARAGHNPPLLKNAGSGGAVHRLDAVGGMPLGITSDIDYETGTITLQRGQTLVLYTDGIVEAMNPQREMFGVEGIERALEICTGEPQCVINSITTALREHEAGVRPADDQTIVALKVE